MTSTPIADHALLSDCHSAALVTTAGSVDWLCFPRFDSPSVLGRLLDDSAGHWSIAPAGPYQVLRGYLEGTLVLQTTFQTTSGVLRLTDALVFGPDTGGHRLGRDAPHLLVRELSCRTGQVEVDIDYAPRPEYGLVAPLLAQVPGGITARGGAEWLVLTTPVDLRVDGARASARLTVEAGQTLRWALHRSTLGEAPAHVWGAYELDQVLEHTCRQWRSWSALHQSYAGPWRELVHHSGRVLQALSYQPSGAIVAAATTSLPETTGGQRNWDYRYSWVRDASFTMRALWVAACPDEAAAYFAFMTTAAAGSFGQGRQLQIMFGVGGEHDLSERALPHLSGWRDSSPVRVGNAAWDQQQVDVYGELLDAAFRLTEQLTDLDVQTRTFLADCADAAARRWTEPDQGIWELRGPPRHFVYSKLMCWVALDRAAAMGDLLGVPEARCTAWKATADQISHALLSDGWSESAGAFTQSFGSTELDASALVIPLVGLLPADDPRVLATIDAVQAQLTDQRGLVYRYRPGDADGLAGAEGTFLLCTFWLAQALAMAGRVEQARTVFVRAVGYANDVGLLAEEVDVATGELLGNMPQAFSHIGLVNAAWAISQAEQAQKDQA